MRTITHQELQKTPPLNAIILENEKLGLENLKTLLSYTCKNVEVIGQGGTIHSGKEIIKGTKKPIDFAFLDIHLDDGLVFNLIPDLKKKGIDFLFVSANPQHAAKAFKLDAAHFVTKPIDPDDLEEAVNRIMLRKQLGITETPTPENPAKKILLYDKNKNYLVEVADIIHCKGSNVYTTFYIKDHPPLLISKNIGFFEELLAPYGFFFRSFKSDLVNINFIDKLIKEDTLTFFILKNGAKIKLSRRRRKQFKELVGG